MNHLDFTVFEWNHRVKMDLIMSGPDIGNIMITHTPTTQAPRLREYVEATAPGRFPELDGLQLVDVIPSGWAGVDTVAQYRRPGAPEFTRAQLPPASTFDALEYTRTHQGPHHV